MSLNEEHIPFQRCIDILEWYIGDKKDIPEDWQNGANVLQAIRVSIDVLKEKMNPVFHE